MIRPSKYLNLGTSVLRISAFILEELQTEPVLRLENLLERVQARAGEESRFNLFPALSFLFLTARLDYDETSDIVYSLVSHGAEVA